MTNVEFCFSHNPEVETERSLAVLKGGLAPKIHRVVKILEPIQLKTAENVINLLEETINKIRTDSPTTQEANTIGYLSGVLLKAIEVGKLEIKLEFIENIIHKKS